MNADKIISLVSAALGGFGSISLIISFLCNRHLRTPATFKIFIMSLCDLPLAFTLPLLTGGPCKLAAFATTFFIVATCSWYCLIAYDLHKIINGKGVPKDLSFWSHLFAWFPSAVAAVAPVSVDSYGEPELQAWLICWYHESEDILKLAIVIPLSFHTIFIFFLLLEFLIKGRGVLKSSPKVQRRVSRHLFLFVVTFFLIWPWLIISCIQDIILVDNRIDWIDDLAVFGFKSSGFFNFLVWIGSPVFSHARTLQKKRMQKRVPSEVEDSDWLSSEESESESDEEDEPSPEHRSFARSISRAIRSSFKTNSSGSLQQELLDTKSHPYSSDSKKKSKDNKIQIDKKHNGGYNKKKVKKKHSQKLQRTNYSKSRSAKEEKEKDKHKRYGTPSPLHITQEMEKTPRVENLGEPIHQTSEKTHYESIEPLAQHMYQRTKTPDLEIIDKHGESISSLDPNLNISSDMSEVSRES